MMRAWRAGWFLAIALIVAGWVIPVVANAMPSEHPFEIGPGSFNFATSSRQAGAHADWVTKIDFAHDASGDTYGDARDIVVDLPAGFDASDVATPTCTQAQLLAQKPDAAGTFPQCALSSQVGMLGLEIKVTEHESQPTRLMVPLFNLEVTSPGVTAELGFKTSLFTGSLKISVRPGDLGLTSATIDIPPVGEVHSITATIWGVPAAKEHDALRGAVCLGPDGTPPVCEDVFGGPQSAGIAAVPLLSNPTSCGMFEAHLAADSWEEQFGEDPAGWPQQASSRVGPIEGCDRVPFDPSIEVQPSTRSAESPSGLEVTLGVTQYWENPLVLSSSYLKDTTVALPEGMTANPSLAAGLGACTPEQYARETYDSGPGAGCPEESKIGSIDIQSPLLVEHIPGAVYLAKPYDNPFGSLLALYVVAKDPLKGVIVKVAGKIEPNPVTGQLVTTFENTPQQPFSKFTLKFRPGATAPLASPPVCGTYMTQASLTPWSAPLEPIAVSNAFQVTQGVHEGPCPSGGAPPLHPRVISGTQNNAAGTYTPFYLRINREDGEQELTRFTTVLPPGLTANLTGIPFCSDAQIQLAREHTGQQELHEPACPATSEIGHTLVGAGVGSVLAWTPGKVYLAGPYHGSALSIVSVTSATVGPFDLGTVVIRFALKINPLTAQAEIDGSGSDPIPHIIDGIVVHVRDIHVYIDRPNFMIDPTSCQHMAIANAITGAGANPANTTDQQTVQASTPFQAADCASLAFKPSFKVSTTGKTSKANGAGLNVKLAYPNAPQGTQANIHSVKVELPLQLPSRLTTLQKACTEQVFDANPASCPSASIVGHAVATTPILPVPVSGPAYFVSHGGAKFPELIVVLQGYGVTVDLHGETFISKKGITSSTFSQVPDVPVNTFELTLPQGPFSALTASSNLCSLTRTITQRKKTTVKIRGHRRTRTRKVRRTVPATLQMPTSFVAQNGATLKQNTRIAVTGCPRAKRKAKTFKRARSRKGRSRGPRKGRR